MKKPIRPIPTVTFSTAIAAVSGACVDDSEVTGDGAETGDEGTPPDGVYINCLNENHSNSWWNFGPDGILIQFSARTRSVL
jgi:hypothetical protein